MEKEKKTIDVSQAAKRLNVSRSTVYRLIEQGELLASKMGTAHCIRIRVEDVEALKHLRQEVQKWM